MRNTEKRRASWRAWCRRPENQAKRRSYLARPEVQARQKFLARIRRSRPEAKAQRRRYLADPKVRFRRKLCRIAIEMEQLEGTARAETLHRWEIEL